MNDELKRSIILDNYQNPANRDRINDSKYIKLNTRSNSCIDNIDLYLLIENNIIKDLKFDGEACVICISTTSIMTKLLIGKTLEEAKKIILNYNNMIDEKDYDKDILKEAIVYNDIVKQPSRKNCATLSWKGIEKELSQK